MSETTNPITKVIEAAGSLAAVARAAGVSHQAVRKWEKRGRLPRSEWTGETRYAEKLEEAFEISRHELAPGAYPEAA